MITRYFDIPNFCATLASKFAPSAEIAIFINGFLSSREKTLAIVPKMLLGKNCHRKLKEFQERQSRWFKFNPRHQ